MEIKRSLIWSYGQSYLIAHTMDKPQTDQYLFNVNINEIQCYNAAFVSSMHIIECLSSVCTFYCIQNFSRYSLLCSCEQSRTRLWRKSSSSRLSMTQYVHLYCCEKARVLKCSLRRHKPRHPFPLQPLLSFTKIAPI